MKTMLKGAALAVLALAATTGSAVPAGSLEPFNVRVVTMNGVSGPAYYSRTAGAYRFISSPVDEGIVASLEVPAR